MNTHWMSTPTTNMAGHRHEQAEEQVDAEVHRQVLAQVGAKDDQDPLGDVDDVHDPEDEGEPGRHQRIDPAGEDPADDGLEH